MASEVPSSRPGPSLPAPQSPLEASEFRYRRLFETAQDAILILDAEERPG